MEIGDDDVDVESIFLGFRVKDGSQPLVERSKAGGITVHFGTRKMVTWSSPRELVAWLDNVRRAAREYMSSAGTV